MDSRFDKLVKFIGLRKSITGMLAMVVLVGMGEHMAERFLPLYIQSLAQGTTMIFAIGLLAGMDDLLSALYSFPGGYLSDKLGSKRALLIFNLLSMFGYVIVILVPKWWAVLLGAAFFISWSAISLPATMTLISVAVPKEKRAMGVSMQSLVRRIPKTLGPVVGGAFIAIWGVTQGVRYAFVAALILAIIAMILQQILIEEDTPEQRRENSKNAEKNPFRLYRRMSPELRAC